MATKSTEYGSWMILNICVCVHVWSSETHYVELDKSQESINRSVQLRVAEATRSANCSMVALQSCTLVTPG